jgi:small subunit ribosomal protein S16
LATRIRLKRIGRKKHPLYRIDVFDGHAPRDGKSLETLGTYDPHQANEADKVELKRDRVVYWIDRGATPSETVASLLRKRGIHV